MASNRSYFKGKNFITPNNRQYYGTEELAIEYAEGKGLTDNRIYGVSVRHKPCGTHSDLTQLFHSERDALHYIEGLLDEEDK